MRTHALGVMVASCLIAAWGAPLVADDAKKELDGTWVVESISRDPKEKGRREGKGFRLIVSGESVVVEAAEKDTTLGKLAIRLDGAKKPKTLEITPEAERVAVLAIYELEGDTLKVCWGPLEKKEGPTEFTAKPGSRQSLIILKRKKQ